MCMPLATGRIGTPSKEFIAWKIVRAYKGNLFVRQGPYFRTEFRRDGWSCAVRPKGDRGLSLAGYHVFRTEQDALNWMEQDALNSAYYGHNYRAVIRVRCRGRRIAFKRRNGWVVEQWRPA